MARAKRYFLSDIHFGVGQPTDWYRREQHEPLLLKALEQIAADPEAKDVVLLGDVFETWVSPINTPPPSAAAIIAEGGHEALTDLDASWRDDRIYVNAGSFCVDRPTFAEVDKRAGSFAVKIWQGSAEAKGFTVVKEASVRG